MEALPKTILYDFNQDEINLVTSTLRDKYNEEFVISMIGDRFNTDHVKLVVHPESDESILFTTIIDYSDEIKDDYISRIVLHKMERQLVSVLSKTDITCVANAVTIYDAFTKTTDKSISANVFFADNNIEKILIRVVFNGTVNSTIYDQIVHWGKEYSFDIRLNGYVLNDVDYFSCKELFDKYVSVSDAMIGSHNPIKTFGMNLFKDGNTDCSYDAFCSAMGVS